MDFINLTRAIAENIFFMRSLTKNFGTPIHLYETECEKIIADLQTDMFMMHRFAFVVNIKTNKLHSHVNVGKFMFKENISLEEFFLKVHPNYMADFIRWGQVMYIYTQELKDKIQPINQTYRITIPLKLKDGKYHWVLQESMAFQLDAEKNMVTHLNIYSVARPFFEEEKIPLVGDIWDENFDHGKWAETLYKRYFTKTPFLLTPELKRIVEVLCDNIELTNTEIADLLSKTKNNIDVQNKDILARAQASFPGQTFKNTREVVSFLKQMNFLQEQIQKLNTDTTNGNKKDD